MHPGGCFRFWLTLAVALACGWARADGLPEPASLPTDGAGVSLAGHVAVLDDPDGAWTIDDVRTEPIELRFTMSGSDRFNFGFDHKVRWYRLVVKNPSAQRADWVLIVGPGGQDYVDIHVVKADGQLATVLTGDRRPGARGLLPSPKFALPLELPPGESRIYVRVLGSIHMADFALWPAPAFHLRTSHEHQTYGIFFGILLVMALYNLVFFVWIRDRAYLYYVLYVVSVAFLAAGFSGYLRLFGQEFAPALAPALSNSIPYAALLANMFMPLFAREFMRLPSVSVGASRTAVFFAALAAVELLVSPALSYATALQLAEIGIIVGAPTMLGYAAWLAFKGLREARFFVLAWCVLIVVIVQLMVLTLVFGQPYSRLNEVGWLFGVALESILLSFALADRFTEERKGRHAATESANRLRSFLPQQVAKLVGEGQHALLEPKRREVTVCVIDLRGFTPFSETAAPEDVMAVLREFYDEMGKVVERHHGTVEHFAGDSMLIFFNAPLEIPEPERQAVQTALEMRAVFEPLRAKWLRNGHELGLGIGIADGFATIGAIGFSGRSQYAAIGAVTNLASRLCGLAQHGEILTTERVVHATGGAFDSESIGDQAIKGFSKPIRVVRIVGLRAHEAPAPAATVAPEVVLRGTMM